MDRLSGYLDGPKYHIDQMLLLVHRETASDDISNLTACFLTAEEGRWYFFHRCWTSHTASRRSPAGVRIDCSGWDSEKMIQQLEDPWINRIGGPLTRLK